MIPRLRCPLIRSRLADAGQKPASRRAGVARASALLLAALWLGGCPTSSLLSPCETDFYKEECPPVEDDARAEIDAAPADARASIDEADDASGTPKLDICAEVDLTAERIVPNVVLVIDQSLSMANPLGEAGSRWDVLRRALLGPDGLIPQFQHRVRFGLALYSAVNGTQELPPPPPIGACPLMTSVNMAMDNLDAIRAVYDASSPLEDTPTGDAVDAVLDDLLARGTIDPARPADLTTPTILILATDGEPDSCEALDPQTGQAEAVAAVQRAYSLDVRTFVLAVAEEAALSAKHVRDMANAGAGVEPGEPDALSFRVQDQADLRQALLEVVSAELSCEVEIGSFYPVERGPCPILVELDDEPLHCEHADGWRRVNDTRLELRGRACARFKTGGRLHLSMPCVLPIAI